MKTKSKDNKYNRILSELQNYRNEDFTFSSGHILGSMCTQPHFISKEVYMKFLETNLGDPELFPGTKEIESKLISFISELCKDFCNFCFSSISTMNHCTIAK
jgi:tyrosine decarboxylase/aspartate 1-decarboxylase